MQIFIAGPNGQRQRVQMQAAGDLARSLLESKQQQWQQALQAEPALFRVIEAEVQHACLGLADQISAGLLAATDQDCQRLSREDLRKKRRKTIARSVRRNRGR